MLCLEKGDKDAILGYKSNSYVFGMVILSLMRMQHNSDIYDFSACEIDRYKVDEVLVSCKDDYSERLVSIVEKMLVNRPEDRMTLRSVLTKLSYKHDNANQQIDIELLNKEKDDDFGLYDYTSEYQKNKEPEYVNYLSGLVYPKVGRKG